jgi:GT2 family glycosyltransferase
MRNFGVVIPCAESRIENLIMCLDHIFDLDMQPKAVVVVCDGFETKHAEEKVKARKNLHFVYNEKHIAGTDTEQPKNRGVRFIDSILNKQLENPINYIWFLDSDIIVDYDCLTFYNLALKSEPNRILIGPYEWLPEGKRKIDKSLYNDPRTQMFKDFDYDYTSVGEINFALANFGGNIVYPLEEFKRVGGFWNELSAGRVEDGEMGLRCAAMGVPMAVVSKARGWHLDHPVNINWKIETNAKEVPMINSRHPWIEKEGIILVEKDGKRFDWVNPKTGKSVNTLEIWNAYE